MERRDPLRARPLAILAASAAAAALGAGIAASAGAAPEAAERSAERPPSAAEVRAATSRFLAARPPAQVPAAPRPGAIAAAKRGPILPGSRVVSFYGAPQLTKTILGRLGPAEAGRRLLRQASRYEGPRRRAVIPAIDLIGVIATASPGADGMYRTRQASEVVATYLARARRIGARLMLDIQPGRSPATAELAALRRWLREPDVDLAIDPEWNVGRRGVPGRTPGSIAAKAVNRLSLRLQRLIARRDLPPKLLAIHQFHSGSVRNPGRIRQRRDVDVILNFDGIGSPAAKRAGYATLAVPRLHNGFSLFYLRDTPLMRPGEVSRLEPEADFVLYQ